MARENQGLQIALIILVILTIGLMVATFFGWSQANHRQSLSVDVHFANHLTVIPGSAVPGA